MKHVYAFFVYLLFSFAFAQVTYKGELSFGVNPSLIASHEISRPQASLTLRGHLELEYAFEPLDFRVVLDPSVSIVGSSVQASSFDFGLTEAFALYRFDRVDVSVGLERLALETARLSQPFSLEPKTSLGQPLGLLGARATVFLEDWRIRPAFLYRYQDEQAGAVLSVKRDFRDFDLEAQFVYLNGFSLGLGGSGLVGDIVVYGEAWLLAQTLNTRAALGLSGFYGDMLWTTELAYAPTFITENATPQVLTQLSMPQGEAGNFDLNLALAITEGNSSGLLAATSLLYSYAESDYQLSLGPALNYSEAATIYSFRLGLTSFF